MSELERILQQRMAKQHFRVASNVSFENFRLIRRASVSSSIISDDSDTQSDYGSLHSRQASTQSTASVRPFGQVSTSVRTPWARIRNKLAPKPNDISVKITTELSSNIGVISVFIQQIEHKSMLTLNEQPSVLEILTLIPVPKKARHFSKGFVIIGIALKKLAVRQKQKHLLLHSWLRLTVSCKLVV